MKIEKNIITFIREGSVRNYCVGMAERKFSIRCNEHVADVKFNRENTALLRLSKKENINILFKEGKLIFRSDFYLQLFVS